MALVTWHTQILCHRPVRVLNDMAARPRVALLYIDSGLGTAPTTIRPHDNKAQRKPMSAIERVEFPTSLKELERRWAAVRKEMEARNIDALITQNSSDWLGGYVKWF